MESDENTAELEWDPAAAQTVADRSPLAVFFAAAAVSLGGVASALAKAGETFDELDIASKLTLVRGAIQLLREHQTDDGDLLIHLKSEEHRLQAIEDGQ
jgi:hypothetical protein